MAHYTSTQIRTDIVARLIVASLVASGHVYNSRVVALEPADLPAILVRSAGFEDANRSIALPSLVRTETISIQTMLQEDTESALSAAIDALTESILSTLFLDGSWIRRYEKIDGIKVDLGMDADADRLRGGSMISFTVRQSVEYTPVVADDLSTVHIDVDLEDDDQIEAQLTITDLEV